MEWKSRYDALHQGFPENAKMPVIGITGNFGDKGCELAEGYFKAVTLAGGTPVVLPPVDDAAVIAAIVDSLDGLILSGGADINPLYYGEEPLPALHSINAKRDDAEFVLTKLAFDRQLPILGICRGCQMLACALGGSVWQDIYSAPFESFKPLNPTLLKHSQELARSVASHHVGLAENTLLKEIFGTETLAVNSFHHQAVHECGPHLKVAGMAPDGVVEAIESSEHKPIVGVQWHPEGFCMGGDLSMQPLFEWLTKEARMFAEAKSVHERVLTLDSHCDTPMFFDKDIHFEQRDEKILVDLHKMHEGRLDATIMVAYVPQNACDAAGHKAAFDYAEAQLNRIDALAASLPQAVEIARTPSDLYRIKAAGKKAIMKGIENGYAIGESLENLNHFAEKGIVYMTLCHNGNNAICGSAKRNETGIGVTPFGAEVVQKMNSLGVMVDLSHAGEKSFYDALDISQQPVVCSHSSAYALCHHPRNLTDEQMRALAKKDGVAQVTFYPGFLRTEGEVSIVDAVAHLEHMIAVMGVEHVGIGTDFDGDGGVPGLANASELINFTKELLKRHYSEEDLRLIWGGNFLRVMEKIQHGRQF